MPKEFTMGTLVLSLFSLKPNTSACPNPTKVLTEGLDPGLTTVHADVLGLSPAHRAEICIARIGVFPFRS